MNRIPEKADVTGLILAGGRGTRMGSLDKGLQHFQGQPLFLHAARRLAPQVGTILVNANRHFEAYAQAGFPVIPDDPVTFSGPLAGFAAGLRQCRTPYMATVPCDSPFFPDTLVSVLGMALAKENADLAVAVTGTHPPYAPQPVFCLMKQALLPHLEAFLETGQRQIAAWHASLKVVYAPFADEAAFYNINTLEALENLENSRIK